MPQRLDASSLPELERLYRTFFAVQADFATALVFPWLIQARGETRRQLYQALLTLGEPKAILDVALSAYEQYGNEDRLTLAASLLMDLGAQAFPALRILARSNRPECVKRTPSSRQKRAII